ncbi:hypothetical protein BGZ83_012019, partial [Gryganskiella cystojenkinii]
MPWYSRNLPPQTALVRATTYLENARNSKDRHRAKKYCDQAKDSLERIEIKATSPLDLNQLIAKYRELGAVFEKWEYGDKARLSHSKANELSVNAVRGAPTALQSVSPLSISSVPVTDPASAPVTAVSSASSLGPSIIQSLAITSTVGRTVAHHDKGIDFVNIFEKDYPPPLIHCKFPGPDERLISTQQLALCLGLLQTSSLPDGDTLTSSAHTWLKVTEKDPEEQERLKDMAKDVIRAYAQDKLKDSKITAEVVLLAPVFEKEDYGILLSQLVHGIEGSPLLASQALEGLAQLLQSASPGYLDADDLVKILKLLNTRLQETHGQSPQHVYQLTLTIAHVLDAMVDCEIKGLDRVNLHEPLLSYMESLKSKKDPYMVFQAAYAYQALLFVPNNESNWQATLRRSGMVLKGVSGLVSAVKGLSVNEFIEGVGNIQGGLEGVGQVYGLAKDSYKGVASMMESGQSLLEALQTGLSFSQKRDWYPLLRGIDLLLRNGELTKFQTLVYEAPCRRDPAFLWGVCQALGELSSDSRWETDARQGAITFLGEIYKNDAVWGQEPQIKQYILDILLQLASASDVIDQASAPVSSSYLIDQVQNKPSVEPALRKYQHRREQEQEQRNPVYIPPQAKATREAHDDDLFDLTRRVNEFLSSDQKVLLLLGDSGAGKSTFNLELEIDLWKAYNYDRKQIPIFVTLPAIDKPEVDLVAKQLRKYDFSDAQIQELKTYREFILICDGYDECQKKNNLYNSNRFNQSGEWKVKMVISCRSEYLGSDYRLLFQPGNRNDLSGGALLQEAVIAPFSKDKIQDYIRQYVQRNETTKESTWNPEDYWHAIESIPTLQELVKNPFLLTLALKVLPLF